MSSYAEVLSQLYELLNSMVTKEGVILTEQTQLMADLGLDSVKVMDLLLRLEDHFDVSIPLNVLPDVRTIKDLAIQLDAIIK